MPTHPCLPRTLPVIVTRPAPQAAQWATELRQRGHAAQALPLMEVGPSTSIAAHNALRAALATWPQCRAIMFVSANAVQYFFQHPLVQQSGILAGLLATVAPEIQPPPRTETHTQVQPKLQIGELDTVLPGMPAPYLGPRCWAPGPGTAQALRIAGVPAHRIDSPPHDATQFDSEALWHALPSHPGPGDCVLIVRGGDSTDPTQGTGRQWLAAQITACAANVQFAPVYERRPPSPTPELLARLRTIHAQSAVWLFSSSECISHLLDLLPATWLRHTAVATHPRIAERARQAGFGRVVETKPSLPAVDAALHQLALHPTAPA